MTVPHMCLCVCRKLCCFFTPLSNSHTQIHSRWAMDQHITGGKSMEALYLAAVQSKKQAQPQEPHVIGPTTVTVNKLRCLRCKRPLIEEGAVRLKPRKKLSVKMQKHLRRQTENKESLTSQQQELVQKSLQSYNILMLACRSCGWKGQSKLQTRAAFHRQKQRLSQKQEEVDLAPNKDSEPADKKAKQKLRKKERRKKVALAKATELVSRLAKASSKSKRTEKESGITNTTPTSVSSHSFPESLPQHSVVSETPAGSEPAEKITIPQRTFSAKQTVSKAGKTSTSLGKTKPSDSVLGMQSSGVKKKKGNQLLKTVLNQQKKATPSAAESLSQFLNSLL